MKAKILHMTAILLVFLAAGIQPAIAATTWIIGPDQEPPLIPPVDIGTWNEETRTFTLADDTPLGENIQIIDSDLTLDGAGYTVTGPVSSPGHGIHLYGTTGVTVKNITVKNCQRGIVLEDSDYNTVINNTTESNISVGIHMQNSNYNEITGNTVSNSSSGILFILYSSNNTVTYNTSFYNKWGIYFQSYSNDNSIYHNNFIDNGTIIYTYGEQAYVDIYSSGNVFSLDATLGGNYWNDWTTPDDDENGIVDNPYIFTGGQDDYPWTEPFVAFQEVGIDIKPGSYPNAININGHGVIPVAVLGSSNFFVEYINIGSLSFAGLEVRVKGNGAPQCSIEDVSGPEGIPDGYPDLVCQFVDDPEAWIPGDAIATLTGSLVDGTPIEGSDSIKVVP